MNLFEFEVHIADNDALKQGVTAREIVKIVVAHSDWRDAYKTAVDVAWRGDRMITGCFWVP